MEQLTDGTGTVVHLLWPSQLQPMSSLFLLDVYGKCLFDETINRRLWVSFSQFKKGSEAFAKILFVAVVDAFFE